MFSTYLYALTSISLVAFYFGAIALVGGLLRGWLGIEAGPEARQAIANGLGYLLMGLPLWWLHWRWLRRQQQPATSQQENRPLAGRVFSFYLFTVLCLSALAILISGGLGITNLVEYALGSGDLAALARGTRGLFALALSVAIWLHHWQYVRQSIGARPHIATPATS